MRRRFVIENEGIIDLSISKETGLRSTANCYIIDRCGRYKFPLVYGNGIKNSKINRAAFTSIGTRYTHSFVDHKNNIIVNPIIKYDVMSIGVHSDSEQLLEYDERYGVVEGEDGLRYVEFKVLKIPSSGANFVIWINGTDGSGAIWSWHIWLWPHDLTPIEITDKEGNQYGLMPINLASKYDENKICLTNWYYQYGRSIPLLPAKKWNIAEDNEYGYIGLMSAHTLSDGICNPTYFCKGETGTYRIWFGDGSNSDEYANLWDSAYIFEENDVGFGKKNSIKTIYDPCPVGWKVPAGLAFTGYKEISGKYGNILTINSNGLACDFALTGKRAKNAILSEMNMYCSAWCSGSEYQMRSIKFGSNEMIIDLAFASTAKSIRPIRDDAAPIIVELIEFKIGTVTHRAEKGMTWYEWALSDYCDGVFQIMNGQISVEGSEKNQDDPTTRMFVVFNGVRVYIYDEVMENVTYTMKY